MVMVTISIGSNIERDVHLRASVSRLREYFTNLILSPVYETAAVGFEGEDFYNLAAAFDTERDVFEVASILKTIEDELGRDRSQPKFSARAIDLDLLTYGDTVLEQANIQIPRHEIIENAFVLKPLADIVGDVQHPQLQRSYQQLWQDMEATAGRIDQVDFEFD